MEFKLIFGAKLSSIPNQFDCDFSQFDYNFRLLCDYRAGQN